ncbi:MAG: helix-turn-helix domain-containing protein [Clostridia bacterium]|nr:helix-turn-helix domain-containing protein [Clostridia bacterium]
MADTMTYIDRIKKLKSEKKITNDRLSEMTGIPLGTLSKILAGISDSPKLVNIVAIADALGCTLDYLISGNPENTNNYTLSAQEIRLVESYRRLDDHGRELTMMVLDKECERVIGADVAPAAEVRSRVLTQPPVRVSTAAAAGLGKRSIRLFDMPVAAGVGIDLDDDMVTELRIPDNAKTEDADYALRISGNSMEPKFHDGDILLVERCEMVEVGELGIFILDGAGYFKKFDGDRLLSLNPVYAPIPLRDFNDIRCAGRVIGKLHRK